MYKILIISLFVLFSCKQPEENNIQITLECTSEIINEDINDENMNAIKTLLKPFENYCNDIEYTSIPKLRIKRIDIDNGIQDVNYKVEYGNSIKQKIGFYIYKNAVDDYNEYIDELNLPTLFSKTSTKDTFLKFENDSLKGIYSIYLKEDHSIGNKEIESIIKSFKNQLCENSNIKNITIRLIKPVSNILDDIVTDYVIEELPVLKIKKVEEKTPQSTFEAMFNFGTNPSRDEINWTNVSDVFKVEIFSKDKNEIIYSASNFKGLRLNLPIPKTHDGVLYQLKVTFISKNTGKMETHTKSFSLINESQKISPTCQF